MGWVRKRGKEKTNRMGLQLGGLLEVMRSSWQRWRRRRMMMMFGMAFPFWGEDFSRGEWC